MAPMFLRKTFWVIEDLQLKGIEKEFTIESFLNFPLRKDDQKPVVRENIPLKFSLMEENEVDVAK